MAYSVLTLRYGKNSHGIYCSAKGKVILAGTEDEMWAWKHLIDEKERVRDNTEYMLKLREERIQILVDGGNTREEAEQFLKNHMNYLYEDKTVKLSFV